jgi:stage II sporulation protein R
MKHNGRFLKALACGLVACVLLSMGRFTAVCGEIRSEVVRLHVLANSDSEADQALKLHVRDAVLAAADGLLDGVTDRAAAVELVSAQLPHLKAAAAACIEEHGYSYPVNVELTEMYFTTRTYDAGTLPAGRYQALRVTIGEGAGHNWWCVVYPPLCLSAAAEPTRLNDVLDEQACEVVEQPERYEVRFKVVEWLEEWFGDGR